MLAPFLIVLVLSLMMLSDMSRLQTSHRQFSELLASCDQLSAAHKRQIAAQESLIGELQKEVGIRQQIEAELRKQITLYKGAP